MNREQQLQHFRELVKLCALSEAWLHQLDKVKENKMVYKHSLKNAVNRAEKEVERVIQDGLLDLYTTDEGLYTKIREGVDYYTDTIMGQTLEYLAATAMAGEEEENS